MNKKFYLEDYRGKIVNFELKNADEVIAVYLMEISGDEVVEFLYKNGNTAYFDSSKTRFQHFFDDGRFVSLKDFLKEHELVD